MERRTLGITEKNHKWMRQKTQVTDEIHRMKTQDPSTQRYTTGELKYKIDM